MIDPAAPVETAPVEAKPVTLGDLSAMAQQYHVPMSDETLAQLAPNGTVTP